MELNIGASETTSFQVWVIISDGGLLAAGGKDIVECRCHHKISNRMGRFRDYGSELPRKQTARDFFVRVRVEVHFKGDRGG